MEPHSCAASLSRNAISRIRNLFAKNYVSEGPGASVLISQGDRVLLNTAFGLRDLGNKLRFEKDTGLPVASLTKQFTAVCVLLLVLEKKLSVSDLVSDHLDCDSLYPRAWHEGITIEHLLTCTSGIPDYTDSPDYYEASEGRSEWSLEKLVCLVRNEPLSFEPGTCFRYCNLGYLLLGAIIEKVSGVKFEEFVQTRILDVAGMRRTFFFRADGKADLTKSEAKGYEYIWEDTGSDAEKIGNHTEFYQSEFPIRPSAPISLPSPSPDGGLVSTVGDFFLWQRALVSAKFHPDLTFDYLQNTAWESFQVCQQVSSTKFDADRETKSRSELFAYRPTYYGYGWIVENFYCEGIQTESGSYYEPGPIKLALHYGDIEGYKSLALYIPEFDVLVAVFTNGFLNVNHKQLVPILVKNLLFQKAQKKKSSYWPVKNTWSFPPEASNYNAEEGQHWDSLGGNYCEEGYNEALDIEMVNEWTGKYSDGEFELTLTKPNIQAAKQKYKNDHEFCFPSINLGGMRTSVSPVVSVKGLEFNTKKKTKFMLKRTRNDVKLVSKAPAGHFVIFPIRHKLGTNIYGTTSSKINFSSDYRHGYYSYSYSDGSSGKKTDWWNKSSSYTCFASTWDYYRSGYHHMDPHLLGAYENEKREADYSYSSYCSSSVRGTMGQNNWHYTSPSAHSSFWSSRFTEKKVSPCRDRDHCSNFRRNYKWLTKHQSFSSHQSKYYCSDRVVGLRLVCGGFEANSYLRTATSSE